MFSNLHFAFASRLDFVALLFDVLFDFVGLLLVSFGLVADAIFRKLAFEARSFSCLDSESRTLSFSSINGRCH